MMLFNIVLFHMMCSGMYRRTPVGSLIRSSYGSNDVYWYSATGQKCCALPSPRMCQLMLLLVMNDGHTHTQCATITQQCMHLEIGYITVAPSRSPTLYLSTATTATPLRRNAMAGLAQSRRMPSRMASCSTMREVLAGTPAGAVINKRST